MLLAVNMRATLQLPPPWHRALERRLESLERNLAEEKNELWKEIYSISTKVEDYVNELSNSSMEIKGSPALIADERIDGEHKMEIDSGHFEALVKGLKDEKQYVRDFINKAEQHRKRTQIEIHDIMESMGNGRSNQIVEGNNAVSSQLAINLNKTIHIRELTDNLESIVIHLQSEVSGLKEEIAKLQPSCGSWNAFKGSCYLISNKLLTWEDARASCHAVGTYLAEVESEEEAGFLINLAKTVDVGYGPWLGASDTSTEGDWVWQFSGRSVNEGFSDWAFNEPNGGTVENCLLMYNSNVHLFHWIDVRCTTKNNFICEK